ncbi:unnamed protein product [Didymodactylos carnosus]|uniref:Uncharacterized protein n=1 Tax=Didymodactylos carnosus TaxID=1234261 RepID=A0A815CXJ9_9BILA|nr:unnamed protein product [Didymodactylos carnosus]CAF1293177.1 unnamed protein product [Didymodactylos carnosus]CAF3788612.1 unnamed protein product [Didymodactylos carnosus]CAF4102731.1 unnamed protein product [Didymodactylos carnosus]
MEEPAHDSITTTATTTITTTTTIISPPESTPNYYELGVQHKATDNLPSALRMFESEISQNPKNAEAWLQLGRTRALLGHNTEALDDLLHVTHLEPTNHEAYYFLGCVYNLLGRYKEAIEVLTTAIEKASGTASSKYYYKLAYACQMDGQYREAAKSYTKYLSVVSENDYSALLNRGLCYYSMTQYNKALTDFEKAVSVSSEEAKLYCLCCRGRAKAKLGDRNGAEEDFNEAQRKSSSPSLSFEAGITNNELHKHRDAIENYSRAIVQNEHKADSYFRRGLSYAILKQYDKAVADYTRAIDEIPGNNHPRAYFRRGSAYVALNKLDDALSDYTRALHLAQYHKDVYLMRAHLYLQLGRAEEATEDFRKATFCEQEEPLEDDIPGKTEQEDPTPKSEPPPIIIDPNSPFGVLKNGLEKERAEEYRGAIDTYNHLFDFDPELFQQQLDKQAHQRDFNRTQAQAVKDTLQKHNDAMKKFGNNMNLKVFYASILFQLEELFIGCKTVASGRVNPSEGRLGQTGNVMNLVGQVITLVPVAGDKISAILQAAATLVKKIDSNRQRNIMTAIAHSGILLYLWEVSQSVAQTLAERYQPLIEQLRQPDDGQDKTQPVGARAVEIVESEYCKCYTKTRQTVFQEAEKTEAKEIGEYAVVLMLAALQDSKIAGDGLSQSLDQELLQVVCIPMNEENKNTEFYFSKRLIVTKMDKTWTLDGFYRKPGIRIKDEEEQYASDEAKKTDSKHYGFRLGTKAEVEQLGLVRVQK